MWDRWLWNSSLLRYGYVDMETGTVFQMQHTDGSITLAITILLYLVVAVGLDWSAAWQHKASKMIGFLSRCSV